MASSSKLPPLPTIKEIIRLYKLRAQKQLSQNFLLDNNLSKKIVRTAGKIQDGWVCEVGPGPGGITRAILEKNPQQLTVIEKDQRFIPGLELLNDASDGKMKIFHGDVLRFDMENIIPQEKAEDWANKTPNIHLIGNLPFNVSTPLIIQWLANISTRTGPWKHGRVRMTLTFQKEVAERMVARINRDQRSRLSIMCQYLCDVRHVFTIPGKAFVPKPDVDVAVVHFVPLIEPKISVPFTYVEKVVRHVFHYRQKMIKHGIRTLFPPERTDLTEQMFTASNVNPALRSYNLRVDHFDRLSQTYQHICDQHPGMLEYYYRSAENAPFWRRRKEALSL